MTNLCVEIQFKSELRAIAAQMKASLVFDQEVYGPESLKSAEGESTRDRLARLIKNVMDSGANRGVTYHGTLYSIACTFNKQNDDQWHLSICRSTDNGLCLVSDEDVEWMLPCFFDDWHEINSPSKMKAVRHFTGNDHVNKN